MLQCFRKKEKSSLLKLPRNIISALRFYKKAAETYKKKRKHREDVDKD